jgi:thioester reductase-like protein
MNFQMLYFLKSNAIAEPLIDRWYAWSYLLSPVSSAMYLANSHIPLLQSFVLAPQTHGSALKDPAMRGGPFINYPVSRREEISAFCDQLQQSHGDLLALVRAVQQLQRELQQSKGESLEQLYGKTPEILKGYVELVYDLHHHASFRLFEALLYGSSFYKTGRQRICLSLENVDQRDFVLSTPRLPGPDLFELNLPFNHPGYDALFAMRDRPQPLDRIMAQLEIPQAKHLAFGQYFTTEISSSTSPCNGESIRIRYFGHACILIETAAVSILCDPLISYDYPEGVARYSYRDLPEQIDYALITHNHQDHVMLETLLQLRHKIKTVIVPQNNPGSLIDPSLKLMLQQIGFKDVRALDELESLPIPQGEITGLPFLGEHGDLNITSKLAYHIQIGNRSIVCAADSNNISPELYQHLRQQLGAIDLLFIGMECEGAPYNWAYGAMLPEMVPRSIAQTRRLNGSNADRAMALVQQLQPEQVYVYALGQEPWLTFITSIDYGEDAVPLKEADRLVAHCQRQGLVSERLYGKAELFLDPKTQPRQIQSLPLTMPISHPVIPSIGGVDGDSLEVVASARSSIIAFIDRLQALDIKLTVTQLGAEPKLNCNAPKGSLNADLKVELTARKAEIIQFLQQESSRTNGATIKQQILEDAQLDQGLTPAQTPSQNTKPQILLTGATGFVGAFLLAELLTTTCAEIHCLVRAKDGDQAMLRLQQTLETYQLWQAEYRSRLFPHCGDLAEPHLGLSSEAFQTLAQQIDIIYHNGAWVHHLLPYETLRITNVLSTRTILTLASQGCRKIIHQISSSSVFVTSAIGGRIEETHKLDPNMLPQTGYAQTKWASEYLMAQAQQRGFEVDIYRLGGISGHSQNGQFNSNDFLYRLLIGTVQLGAYPHDRSFNLRVLPIDYVTKAIVTLAQQDSHRNTYHLIHPTPVDAQIIFEQLHRRQYALTALTYGDWRKAVLDIARTDPTHPLYPLVALLPTQNPGANPEVEFATDITQTMLKLAPPNINHALINVYINYLIEQHHIPVP